MRLQARSMLSSDVRLSVCLSHSCIEWCCTGYALVLCFAPLGVCSGRCFRETFYVFSLKLRCRLSSVADSTVAVCSVTTLLQSSFAAAAPRAWNRLPDVVRNSALSEDAFAKLLKTNLMNSM